MSLPLCSLRVKDADMNEIWHYLERDPACAMQVHTVGSPMIFPNRKSPFPLAFKQLSDCLFQLSLKLFRRRVIGLWHYQKKIWGYEEDDEFRILMTEVTRNEESSHLALYLQRKRLHFGNGNGCQLIVENAQTKHRGDASNSVGIGSQSTPVMNSVMLMYQP
ncbi:hypothetical protein ACTXT7_000079 [Hymenolepis weldensis]